MSLSFFVDVVFDAVRLSLSLSLVLGVVSGVIISCGFGVFCNIWYLLFVTMAGEVKDSSSCCVVGNEFVSGTMVVSSAVSCGFGLGVISCWVSC